MGFLGFGKKNEPVAPPNFDINKLSTDIPSIEGLALPDALQGQPLDLPPQPMQEDNQYNQNMQMQQNQGYPSMQQPMRQSSQQNFQPSTQSGMPELDMPPLDLTLSDEDSAKAEAMMPDSMHDESADISMNNDNTNMPSLNPFEQQSLPQAPQKSSGFLDYEDLNNLFLKDDWKEPDFNNFDPYHEEKIDAPAAQDFGGSMKLPSFDNDLNDVHDDAGLFDRREKRMTPVEIYIKDAKYKDVFEDLTLINDLLVKQESDMESVEDLFKRKTALLASSKDNMELIYKKMLMADKRLFVG